ncbi:MAG: MnhB domain-containing protein [Marinilabiliaceae bacterium]
MKNIVLEKIIKLFLFVMTGFALFVLLRGHDRPGGGFIAGIIASAGFLMYALVFGSDKLLDLLKMNPRYIMGIGLLISLVAALMPALWGLPPMTAMWQEIKIIPMPTIHAGTPLLFDTGVFVLVTGVVLGIITSIMDVLKWNS